MQRRGLLAGVCLLLLALAAHAEEPPPAAAAAGDQLLTAAELDQLLAPIALYPDDLVAQVLMASTYPLEIVEAARWAKKPENAKLTGEALDKALAAQSWDVSVKSLVPFKDVLANMDEKLDWTQKLGDAFLAQQKDVMDAVQRLRSRADEAGNLKSNEQQTVTKETATDPATQTQTQTIIIQPANPQVIYVPVYQPTVVYGAWPYPSYPPYYYPAPPGAIFAAGFFWGAAIGASASYWGWGHCGWHGDDIDIDVNHKYKFESDRNVKRENNGKWKHDPGHRKGVNYRNASTREQYGKGTARDAASRESFRGRQNAGAGVENRGVGASNRAGDRGAVANRGGAGTGARPGGDRAGSAGQRPSASSRDAGAFDRMGGGSSARASSARGRSSFGGAGMGGGTSRGGGMRGGGGRR